MRKLAVYVYSYYFLTDKKNYVLKKEKSLNCNF